MIDALANDLGRGPGRSAATKPARKLRLAYFSPLPPVHSGIADYSWQLLPHLARPAHITVFHDQAELTDPGPEAPFRLRPAADYPGVRHHFDLVLYQMGNNIIHEPIYRLALRYPGVVVLHDYGLSHFLASTAGTAGRYDEYVRELGYVMGLDGVDLAWQVRYGGRPYPLYELPMNDRLLDRSLALIVHSHSVARMVRRQRPALMAGVVPQLMPLSQATADRAQLSIPEEALVLASIGQATAAKRLDMALRAFSRLRDDFPDALYLLVGESSEEVDLAELVESLGLAESVRLTGYAPTLQHFESWTAAADLVVGLRQPTIGETSAAALRALATGRPLIVFDHGWYSELPDEVCLKVKPGDEEALYQAMRRLAGRPEERREMGRQARSYIGRQHDPAAAAGAYVDFLWSVLAGINRRYGGP